MAMALEKQPLKAENLEKFQKLNEASKAFIKEALTLEESNSQSMVKSFPKKCFLEFLTFEISKKIFSGFIAL